MHEFAERHHKANSHHQFRVPKQGSLSQADRSAHPPLTGQQSLSNQAVQRMLRSGIVQAKLTVNPADDEYEREADRVAERVMNMPEPEAYKQVQRSCSKCDEDMQRQPETEDEEESVQAKPIAERITPFIQRQVEPEEDEPVQARINEQVQKQEESGEEEETIQEKGSGGEGLQISHRLEAHIRSMLGGGQSLSPQVRGFFEPRFGHDFRGVRVYNDGRATEAAHAVNARAFTLDRNIIFGEGEYLPQTVAGKKLLAHELTHVIQQGQRFHTNRAETEAGRLKDAFKNRANKNIPLWTQGNSRGAVRTDISMPSTTSIQASFISFVLKMGAKRVSKGMLKNFIKTKIKDKIVRIAEQRFAKRFLKESEELMGILEDPWWATAIGFIPIAGDFFDLVRVPKQISNAIKKANALEERIQKILKMQGMKARDLIREHHKRGKDYPSELENYTYKKILELATGGNTFAKKLKKLIEATHRLSERY